MTSGFTHETATSKSIEWYTPAWVFEALNVSFDLDPCTPGLELTHVPATKGYTAEDDGLTSDWYGHVWCNPPYGRGIDKWLTRCAWLAETGDGAAIALVPNRTDTTWFQTAAQHADAILFPASRIKFHPGHKDAPFSGSPGTGSALLGFGAWAAVTLRESALTGFITTPRNGYFLKRCQA